MLSEERIRSLPPGLEFRVATFARDFHLTSEQTQELQRTVSARRFSLPDLDTVIALAVIEILFNHWLQTDGKRYRSSTNSAHTAMVESEIATLVYRAATYVFERNEGGWWQYLANTVLYALGQLHRRPKSHTRYVSSLHEPAFKALCKRWQLRCQ